MRYAIIKNGIVENVIDADAEFVAALPDHCEFSDVAGIGWTWDGEFTPPPAPPALPQLRHISVGQFFDSFGAQKYPILASDNPNVKALILDCQVRSYIDLDNQSLPAGLAMLVALGFAIDPNAIINQVI